MLALGFEEERMPAEDIDASLSAKCLVDFGNFSGGRDRVTDDATADLTHDVGDCAVAVDDVGDAGVFNALDFHDDPSKLVVEDLLAEIFAALISHRRTISRNEYCVLTQINLY
jgi:hypothetical protein